MQAATESGSKMLPVDAPENAIDIVGTGGDQSGSYNVSTASALVAAAAGAVVAKHGNRALSSKSGTADTLEVLGVNLECSAEGISKCISDAGVGFMFAPMHHSAMRHVGPSRVELGTRTIFNILGPLSNPAGVKRHMIGVFSPEWVEPLAHVLKELGSGGMGQVYLAEHMSMKRVVAIKILTPGELSTERRDRFIREIESVAKLNHPHIVNVFDFDRDKGNVFMTMEYLQGEGLDELLKARNGRAFPADEAIGYIEQMAQALRYAHAGGVIHSDFKPGNVLVGAGDGRVCVADFGLALHRGIVPVHAWPVLDAVVAAQLCRDATWCRC